MPEIYPWMLFLHVMAAIIAFGPTFAFSIIGAMGGSEPQHANFGTRVSQRIGHILVEPFAISMFFTGALLIWSAEIPLFERDARWLLVAIVLYFVSLGLSFFVSQPNVRRIVTMSGGEAPAGPPPPEMLRAIGVVQRTGMALTLLLVIIVFLMVMKPDFGF